MGQIAEDQFDGPLDVLLQLVERGKIEVTQLSISRITTAYFIQIQNLKTRSVEGLSDFIQLGSRLLYIKSQALLPVSSQPALEDLARLNLELADYRTTRLAAQALKNLPETKTFERPVRTEINRDLPAAAHIPLNVAILRDAVSNLQRRTRRQWPAKLAPSQPKLTLEAATAQLATRIHVSPTTLKQLIQDAPTKREAIVWILACLELAKSGSIRLKPTVTADTYELETVGV